MTSTETPTPASTATPDPVATEALRSALSSGPRPPRPSAVSTSLTHGWRALLKIKHVPEQLFDVTVFPIMLLLMFTYLFGGAFMGSTRDYLQFFLPGILVQSVVMITMYSGVGLNVDAEKGVFDRFRSMPVWRPSAIVGALLGDALRYTLAATVMISLGLVLGFRPGGGPAAVVAAVALLLVFAFSLSWVWTTLGLVLRTEKSVMGTSMMILFPLTFASNIFVDPQTMPSWLQRVVEINPVSRVVSAVRGLMGGDLPTADLAWSLAVSVLLVAIFAPLTMRLYRTKG